MSSASVPALGRDRTSLLIAQGILLVLAGATTAVVLEQASARLGVLVAVLPLALVAAWALVGRPGVTLGILTGAAIVAEESDVGFLSVTAHWYDEVAGGLQLTDLLLGLLLVGVVVDGVRRRAGFPRLGVLAYPLALLAAGAAAGTLAGWVNPARNVDAFFDSLRILGYLVVVPFATAHVLARDPDRRMRLAAGVVAALVGIKATVGLAAWVAGQGREFGETRLVFYEPAMNFLLVALLLGVVAAWLSRLAVPRWLLLSTPVAVATLVLSFRRSFWIAAVLGLVIVLVVATGRRGRPWVILLTALLGVAVWLSLVGGGATTTTNPVVERARSLSPTELTGNTDDRYRLDEQKNVIEELRRHPLTGLGLGVPWSARHPLSVENEGGRHYTHVTPLWFWLKLGPLGLAAYAWLTAAVIATGLAVWRRQQDRLLRVTGLAVAAAWVGLVVAELTGGFTGINRRITLIEAAMIGWLAVAAARQPTTERYTSAVPATMASRG